MNDVGTYNVILTCRNSQRYIESAIKSLIDQSKRPQYIIVVDDGSSDGTPNILRDLASKIQNVHVITNPDLGYDIGRVVRNWNKALKLSKEFSLKPTKYHMISTDDSVFDPKYCETIMKYMDSDPTIAISSGNYDDKNYVSPHGAGRFVSNLFFSSVLDYYPEKMGYESAVLYMALQAGYRYTVIQEARFNHTRRLGTNHHFYEFGASMRTLGYHPLFVLGRFVKYLWSGKPIGRIGSLYMIYYYLSYKPKDEGYDSMYDVKTRRIIRSIQKSRIKQVIGTGPRSRQ